MPISTEFYIFYKQTGEILSFKAAEIMRKFRFELARDDCANTLWRTKFRLLRRINFLGRSAAKFKTRFDDQI